MRQSLPSPSLWSYGVIGLWMVVATAPLLDGNLASLLVCMLGPASLIGGAVEGYWERQRAAQATEIAVFEQHLRYVLAAGLGMIGVGLLCVGVRLTVFYAIWLWTLGAVLLTIGVVNAGFAIRQILERRSYRAFDGWLVLLALFGGLELLVIAITP